METNDRQKSWLKVWGGRLLNMIFFFCMLFVVYLVSGVFIVTSFKIPSDSMEPSLQTGDCILVDKCSKRSEAVRCVCRIGKEGGENSPYAWVEENSRGMMCLYSISLIREDGTALPLM